MEIRANDLFTAVLDQGKRDIAEVEEASRGRAIVALVDFAFSDVSAESAKAVKELLLRSDRIPAWDQEWVLPEVARAMLDALVAWQSVAGIVLDKLNKMDETEAIRVLRARLSEACAREAAYTA